MARDSDISSPSGKPISSKNLGLYLSLANKIIFVRMKDIVNVTFFTTNLSCLLVSPIGKLLIQKKRGNY